MVKKREYHTFTEEEAAELEAKGELRGRKTEQRIVDDFEGTCLGFFQEQSDGETYVVALVEKDDGTLHTPAVHMTQLLISPIV
jgi:hypothetical protein